MSTSKRLYFYVVSFVTLLVTAFGAALLLTYLLDTVLGRRIVGGVNEQASLGIAMVIVGGPLWAVHWRLTHAQVQRTPDEAGAVLRKLYAYGALFIAAVLTLISVLGLVQWALGAADFNAAPLAQAVVWGTVWAFHWTQERAEGQPSDEARTVRRLYLYGVSLIALVMLATGVNGVLETLLLRVYDGLVGSDAARLTTPSLFDNAMRESLAAVLAGGVWWAAHWLVFARGDASSTLRQVYLYLFAFLVGGVAVLASTAAIIYTALQWLLDAPGADATAYAQFRAIPDALAPLLIGLGVLVYHWAVVQEESARVRERLPGARRSFRYIMSALGLASLVAGIVLLIGGIVSFLLPTPGDPLTGTDAWRDPLAQALTLVIIGAPLWFWYWSRAQRQVAVEDLRERTAVSRRIFLYAALGVLALLTVGGLVGILSLLLNDLLEGRLSLDFLRDGKWFLAIAMTAGGFLAYHVQVLREDQLAGAEAAGGGKQVTLVVGEGQQELVDLLEERLGVRLRVLRVVGPDAHPPVPLTNQDLTRYAEQVRGAPTANVLLVAGSEGLQVYAYR